jgi:RHS repeat-associated protein
LLLLFLAPFISLQAQVGNNNPAGVAGIFNGEAGGRPVDPYTGNGTTSIVDLSIAAGVGDYSSLALVRTANSRSIVSNNPFGMPGGWNHSYNWILNSNVSTTANFHPIWYGVDFPDGRVEVFQQVNWDSNYRVISATGVPKGVRNRFLPLNLSSMLAYLLLPDGGQVEFSATQHSVLYNGTTYYYYKYKATALVDPYGVRTSFTYDGQGRVSMVAQPQATGRSLQFYYRPNNSLLIDHVTEVINGFNRRTVQYNYSNISPGGTTYLALTSVSYYGQSQWNAYYKYRVPNITPTNGIPLLWTCDEPTYSGPMKRIAYTYQTANNADGTTPVYGQVYQEKYWDGIANHEGQGASVFTLTVGAPNNRNTRKETRGDNVARTFTYGTANLSGFLTSCTDFMNHSASQTYDAKNYINSVTDRNGHTTNYASDPVTGNVTQIQYPLTQADTPGQGVRPTVNYAYVNEYYMNSSQDEAGNITLFFRDPSTHRITQINYPDTGYEQFTYNGFGQVTYHRMSTGGTEAFTYDARGLKQTYSDPTNIGYNPSLRYHYDGLDRVIAITDAFGSDDPSGDPNHSTSFSYNDRGQVLVTTLPKDPADILNRRFTISNAYNPDGTLQSKTNQLGFSTSYTYDDYRRLKSVTPPGRGDGTGALTTNFYYDTNGSGDDYRYTDSKVTWTVLPSGKKTKTDYDGNRRTWHVTVGYGTADAATTGYTYDNVGNVTVVTNPRNQPTTTAYDERNRPSSITDALNHPTSFTYDTGGRKKSVTRPNNQIISYDTYDAMNRVTQQTASSAGTTKYSYYPGSGLLQNMKDPHLVDLNNGYQYAYEYDAMGRKKKVTYPPDSANVQRTEQFAYDAMGRLQTFVNRNGKVQTFEFDALNRMTDFFWNDGGTTPRVDFTYDVGSRLTDTNNPNATIHRVYWNDNLLRSETETATGGASRAATYFYDVDSNRAGSDASHPGLGIPGYWFTYNYNNRNQLWQIKSGNTTLATYTYDQNGYTGDLTTRTLANNTSSTYQYDALDRVTHVTHALNVRNTRTFDYAYDTVGNRKWTKRDGGNGDSFLYDYNDQVTALRLDVSNPESPPIRDTIFYDSNGNRTSFALTVNGPTDTYTTNNLNQYTQRNAANAAYDNNGNLTTGVDGSTYTYNSQNRLTSASKNGLTMSFTYDGLNRQVSRTANGVTTYSVWGGWDLVQEYHMSGNTVVEDASYLYGPTGLVKNLKTNNYYYQDGNGSTSHLANSSGTLLEWYRYDLQGTPFVNGDPNNHVSAFGVRHLFTGQQWYSEIGLYDMRNRFYSPDFGRFLQPDPIQFWGDPVNLYRYVRNNPIRWNDPLGLENPWDHTEAEKGGEQVIVFGSPIDPDDAFGYNPNFSGPPWQMPDAFGDPFGGPREHQGPDRGDREKNNKGSPEDKKTPKDNMPPQNPETPPPILPASTPNPSTTNPANTPSAPNPMNPANWSKQTWQDINTQYATNMGISFVATQTALRNITMSGGAPIIVVPNAFAGAAGFGLWIGSTIGYGISSVMVAVSDRL